MLNRPFHLRLLFISSALAVCLLLACTESIPSENPTPPTPPVPLVQQAKISSESPTRLPESSAPIEKQPTATSTRPPKAAPVATQTPEPSPVPSTEPAVVNSPSSPNHKLIIVQGVDSNSAELISRIPPFLRQLQSWPTSDIAFEGKDVVGFSYSGNYDSVSLEKYQRLVPSYEATDTCSGVEAAATKLSRLVKYISDSEPDTVFDFVGHSMGGMVIAYWVYLQETAYLQQNVGSVVTIDSPLYDGHPLAILKLLSGCQSSADLLPGSPILAAINDYSRTTDRVTFYHINSSAIGDAFPNGVRLPSTCGDVSIEVTAQWLFHSCLWDEAATHSWVARIVLDEASITKTRVTITDFTDVSLVWPDIFGGSGDPYFVVSVNGLSAKSRVYLDSDRVRDVGPFIFGLTDDARFVEVGIEVWDSELGSPDQYDVSGDRELTLMFTYNPQRGAIRVSGDGRKDGYTVGNHGVINVHVESVTR